MPRAQKVVLYGVEGIGKSTLAAAMAPLAAPGGRALSRYGGWVFPAGCGSDPDPFPRDGGGGLFAVGAGGAWRREAVCAGGAGYDGLGV